MMIKLTKEPTIDYFAAFYEDVVGLATQFQLPLFTFTTGAGTWTAVLYDGKLIGYFQNKTA